MRRRSLRPPEEWTDLDALTRYVVEHHHKYVATSSPTIAAWLDQLVDQHGGRHPELAEVRATFRQAAGELASHMAKEENLLFPFINDLAAARRAGERLPKGPFGTILNPVRVMEAEHQLVGALVARLRALTNSYAPPGDASTMYRRCYRELARFDADLQRHVDLENNLLFPRALELEHGLT